VDSILCTIGSTVACLHLDAQQSTHKFVNISSRPLPIHHPGFYIIVLRHFNPALELIFWFWLWRKRSKICVTWMFYKPFRPEIPYSHVDIISWCSCAWKPEKKIKPETSIARHTTQICEVETHTDIASFYIIFLLNFCSD
jgi:hypothetical protein